jgi:hypothetical protein
MAHAGFSIELPATRINEAIAMKKSFSRRSFLASSAILLGGSCLAIPPGELQAAVQQMASTGDWQVLKPSEVVGLEALADQIWPGDDTPGASALGAVRFMDAALGGFMADALPLVQSGVRDLQKRSKALNPSVSGIAQLSSSQQHEVIVAVEQTPFFSTVHTMVLLGLFALPKYGGNRDQGGWTQLGFESRHWWHPPFGYYDARHAGERNERE